MILLLVIGIICLVLGSMLTDWRSVTLQVLDDLIEDKEGSE